MMGLAEEICEKAHKAKWNNGRWWDSHGILLRGVSKEDIKRGDFLTNCPRMKRAVELCGGEVVKISMITGIENFCKLM